MSDCTVVCQTCRTDTNQPRTWHWLCEDCATEHAQHHRAKTGHPVELNITVEQTLDSLRKTWQVAAIMGRRFW